mgnify:FL=1
MPILMNADPVDLDKVAAAWIEGKLKGIIVRREDAGIIFDDQFLKIAKTGESIARRLSPRDFILRLLTGDITSDLTTKSTATNWIYRLLTRRGANIILVLAEEAILKPELLLDKQIETIENEAQIALDAEAINDTKLLNWTLAQFYVELDKAKRLARMLQLPITLGPLAEIALLKFMQRPIEK